MEDVYEDTEALELPLPPFPPIFVEIPTHDTPCIPPRMIESMTHAHTNETKFRDEDNSTKPIVIRRDRLNENEKLKSLNNGDKSYKKKWLAKHNPWPQFKTHVLCRLKYLTFSVICMCVIIFFVYPLYIWYDKVFLRLPSNKIDDNSKLTAAHLVLEPYNQSKNEHLGKGKYSLGDWISDKGITFTSGVGINGSRVLIKKKGYYQIYSQVHIREAKHDTNTTTVLTQPGKMKRIRCIHTTNMVRKQNANKGDVVLLKSSYTKQCDNFEHYSSFHSGIFRLLRGDEVFVDVEIPDGVALTRSKEGTFLGILLLGDNQQQDNQKES